MVENRERVLSFLEVFHSGNIEAALARCSDDIDFFANTPIDILPHLGPRRGKAEVRTMWEIIHSRYSDMRYQASIIVAEGDKVAVCKRLFMRKRRSERIVQFDVANFYTLHDGLITGIREIMDSFDLVQQVLERDVVALITGEASGLI
jgi:ketosteroid isomerase-like protein